MRTGILFFFHCKSNTGYAIETLEYIFRLAAKTNYTNNSIYFAYPDIKNGLSNAFPANFTNVIKFDPNTKDISQLHYIYSFIKERKIKVTVGFDQGPYKKFYKFFKRAGVKKIISYWGAPMGDPSNILKLVVKKFLLMIAPWPQPDLYIFESKAMANSAILGRGVSPKKIQVVRLGVDTNKFRPATSNKEKKYAYKQFNIPEHRKIIFYSGHMEKRKGVTVIIKAAIDVIEQRGRRDVHFLLLGNQPNEEKPYMQMLEGTTAHKHVTFGGYRNDIAEIHRSCYLGVIASTGWDSFTMSSIEMMSSGLPLLVSSLQGLKETVVNGKTGFLFPPGDSEALASNLLALLEGSAEKKNMLALQARERAFRKFSQNRQVTQLSHLFRHINNNTTQSEN
ncbi:MAG TPA: glycosyltransferase [Gammaproteobacteria bacterium]|nr:glycosyltransferase [Gammaproteobacteria bacterium]